MEFGVNGITADLSHDFDTTEKHDSVLDHLIQHPFMHYKRKIEHAHYLCASNTQPYLLVTNAMQEYVYML